MRKISVIAIACILAILAWLMIFVSKRGESFRTQAPAYKAPTAARSKSDRPLLFPPGDRRLIHKDTEFPERSSGLPDVELLRETSRSGTSVERRTAAFKLMEYYSKNDPDEGLKWLLGIDPLQEPGGYFSAFASMVAFTNEPKFLALAKTLEGTSQFESFLNGGLRTISGRNFDRAMRILRANSDFAEDKESFEKSAFLNMAQVNGDEAAKRIDFGNEPDQALEFFGRAVFKNQDLAVSDLEKIKDVETRAAAIADYGRGCMLDAKIEFGNALVRSTLPQPVRDEAIASVVNYLFDDDLRASAGLVKEIEDETLRNTMIEKIVKYADSKGKVVGETTRGLLGR